MEKAYFYLQEVVYGVEWLNMSTEWNGTVMVPLSNKRDVETDG